MISRVGAPDAALALGTLHRLSAAVRWLPGRPGGALRQRVAELAACLSPGAGRADVATQLLVVSDNLAGGDPTVAWLALAVLHAELPITADVQRLARAVQLDGAIVSLARMVLQESVPSVTVRRALPVVRITSGVVVDVQHTARTTLATGIQRVARETVRRWDAEHDIELVGWTGRLTALRRLPHAERARALTGTEPQAGAQDDLVIVPWHGTYLLPELAPERERTARLAALAQYARSRTGVIGFDCVPISSAETTDLGVSEAFAGNLSALKHFDTVASISHAAGSEYRGWRHMLSAVGLRGPAIVPVLLPGQAGASSSGDLEAARARFVVGDLPLLLCVGTHEPRKNHVAVLHAAESAWRTGARFSLSFVGGHSWSSSRFEELLRQLQAHGRPVDAHSGVSDAVLWSAYRLARAVVFPSLNEGFGLPVAEALSVGTPAVTSGFGSMAEIARDGGAVLVDPRDDADLAAAIARIVEDDELHNRLSEQALRRSAQTWDDYSSAVWRTLTTASVQE